MFEIRRQGGMKMPTAKVAVRSKQAAEASPFSKWTWVEPSIWTEKMLTALDNGVKGVYRLFCRFGALLSFGGSNSCMSILKRNLLTGEPYAGKPHVRFGGRGVSTPRPLSW